MMQKTALLYVNHVTVLTIHTSLRAWILLWISETLVLLTVKLPNQQVKLQIQHVRVVVEGPNYLESMESEEIALNHYQSRLLASTFGAWIAWLNSEKVENARNETTALSFSHNRSLESVVNRFVSGVYQANKRKYNMVLGHTMCKLLLIRRGLHSLWRFLHRKRLAYNKQQRKSIIDFTVNHSAKLRLYCRLRLKVSRRLHVRDGVNHALRDPSSGYCGIATTALQLLTNHAAKCIQHRALLRRSAVHWKRAVKRRYLRHWLLSSCAHKEDRALEQACMQVYYRVQAKRRVLKRFAAALHHTQQAQQLMVAVKYTSLTHKHRRGLLQLWKHAHNRKRVTLDAAVLFVYSSGKAKRRVFVQLLRLLKIRYSETAPLQSKVAIHVMHMWAFRRKSEMWLQWQCQHQRWKLEQRRTKIASFHYRQRSLKRSFHTFTTALSALRTQRNKRLVGECAVYRKCALVGIQALQKRQLIAQISTINNYKAMLCYKYYRSIQGLYALRKYASTRKYKRTVLRDAHVSFAVAHRKAACVEFMHVALDAPMTTEAQHVSRADTQLLMYMFGVWKGLRRVNNNSGRRNIVHGTSSGARDVRNTTYGGGSMQSVTSATAPAAVLSTRPAGCDSKELHSSMPAALSRAKPRCDIPAPLPLPVPHKKALLDHKYLQHTTTTPTEMSYPGNGTTSYASYAYLSASTALPRPSHLPPPLSQAPHTAPTQARAMPNPSPTAAIITHPLSTGASYPYTHSHPPNAPEDTAAAVADSKFSFHKLQDPTTVLLVSDILKTLQECKQLLY